VCAFSRASILECAWALTRTRRYDAPMPNVTLDHATIHYAERGNGAKCIVLIHGFPVDSRLWDRVLAPPPAGVRVIVPDLPGFGRSTTNRAFTIESLADDIHQLLSCIGVHTCTIGGFSLGGYVALAYAKRFASALNGLMLINTRAEGDSAEGREKRNKSIQTVRESGSRAIADAMFPSMLTKEHQSDAAIAGPFRQMMESQSPQAVEFALAAMRDRADQTANLPSIAIPTLIIASESDAVIPTSAAQAMKQAIPRSHLVMVANASHAAPVENPRAVERAICEFID
jgi:pimeloyl-ACP methyl ester carboxylesterase